jgi:hypothetical protein
MAGWQPYREPLRVTLTRTIGIAMFAAAVAAPWLGGFRRWPMLVVLMLWPSFGGHWIDLFFLNWLRERLPSATLVQRVARIALWFAGGMVLALGARLTAALIFSRPPATWLPWAVAGAAFVAIELVAHAALQFRGRPSFYNGLG